MKKGICLLLALGVSVSASGCGDRMPVRYEKLLEFASAYQSGDTVTQKALLQENHPWNKVLDAQGKTDATVEETIYQKAFECLRDTDIVVREPERRSDEQYSVTVTAKDLDGAIGRSMAEAIAAEVETGEGQFKDVASWLGDGIADAAKGEAKELAVLVQKDGKDYYLDTAANEPFFNAVTGGFTDYLNTSMTVCNGTEDGITDIMYIAAKGDYLIGMVEVMEQEYDVTGYSDEEKEELLAIGVSDFQGLDGVTSHAEFADGKLCIRVGVDFNTVDSYTLSKLGLISGSMMGSYLSLEQTVSGFRDAGQTCESMEWGQ